jgi:hypothetical protein
MVVPMFMEIETASAETAVISAGIVCMSAISHKVNISSESVNGYLGGK